MKQPQRKLILFFILYFSIGLASLAHSQTKNLKIGDPAPTFVLKSLDGNYVYLRDFCGKLRPPIRLKKQHVIIISFFATWCKPCMKEIPELNKIEARFKNHGLKIFMIDLKEERQIVTKFARERKLPGAILLDKYGMAAKKYGVESLPRLFLIDRNGKLVWKTKGYQE
ncbi:MAG: TlpA family protein disulfide reductase, partial [Calditrichaeota bacterium]|nr:TlpA family protein disulfide reductase [Calditrichota bacterium]